MIPTSYFQSYKFPFGSRTFVEYCSCRFGYHKKINYILFLIQINLNASCKQSNKSHPTLSTLPHPRAPCMTIHHSPLVPLVSPSNTLTLGPLFHRLISTLPCARCITIQHPIIVPRVSPSITLPLCPLYHHSAPLYHHPPHPPLGP